MTDPGDRFSTAAAPAQGRALKNPPGVQQNYERALGYAVQPVEVPPFNLDRLKTVHKRLIAGEDGSESTPGQFRTSQNWVGPPGSTLETAPFVPPPASRLLPLLSQLETYTATSTRLPPLIQVGLVHYQLAALHPFTNGNGRTVRIFTSALLNAWGGLPHPLLHLSAYLDRNRGSYFDRLMAVSRKSAWEAWLSFFLAGVTAEAYETRDRLHNLNNLREGYHQATAGNRAAARLTAVIDHLFTQPVADINQVAAAIGVNYPVAQRYIQQLEAAGIVREITGQARNRLYCAERILETIES
jgi:Fic family protein